MYTFLGSSCPQCVHQILYMHENTTIGIHKQEVPKLVYTLFWCKPVVIHKIAFSVVKQNITNIATTKKVELHIHRAGYQNPVPFIWHVFIC